MGMAGSRKAVLDQIGPGIVDGPRKDLLLRNAAICALRPLIQLLARQAARETMREQSFSNMPSAMDVAP
jgi:hypothetical protein